MWKKRTFQRSFLWYNSGCLILLESQGDSQNITKSYKISTVASVSRLGEARHMARLKGLFGAGFGRGTEVRVGTQPDWTESMK